MKIGEIYKYGETYFVLCPFHDEKNPSCAFSPSLGLFHCFGCGRSGRLEELIRYYPEIEKLRNGNNAKSYIDNIDFRRMYETAPNLGGLAVEFLKEKNILISIARKFRLKGRNECIYVPVPPIGYMSGLLIRKFPKEYRFYGRKRLYLNFVPVDDYLVVCESPWTVMRLQEYKVPAGATLGTEVSYIVLQDIISCRPRKVFICFDNDEGGKIGRENLVGLLENFGVSACVLSFSKRDPEECVDEIIEKIKKLKNK
jgi:DNA primase